MMSRHRGESATILSRGGRARARVELLSRGGQPAVLKTFAESPALFRWSAGRFMASREALAYRRLGGLAGVPQLLARPEPYALLLEYREGVPIWQARPGDLNRDFFRALERLLRSLRSRGVLHCDVANNVLRSSRGEPVLCDLGASFVVRRWMGPLGAFLVNLRARYDERVVAKLKKRYAPAIATAGDRSLAAKPLPFERVIRIFEKTLAAGVRLLQ